MNIFGSGEGQSVQVEGLGRDVEEADCHLGGGERGELEGGYVLEGGGGGGAAELGELVLADLVVELVDVDLVVG